MIKQTCKNCSIEFTKKHNPNRVYDFCSYKCRADKTKQNKRIEIICLYCGKFFYNIKYYESQKCCSYSCANKFKDKGKTSFVFRLRTSKVYANWRAQIFERDNYTCQVCGQYGGKLNADHIKSFAKFPENRFDLDNGRTLCIPCHKKTDNFGGRANKKASAQEA